MNDRPSPNRRRIYLTLMAVLMLAAAASGVVFSSFNASAIAIIAFGLFTGFAFYFLLKQANGWNTPPYQPPE